MLIQFYDREKELKEIKNILSSNRFELLIIYGRRRVGKTELILQATKKKRIYYLATEEKNLERFHKVCAQYRESMKDLRMDWETLFKNLKGEIIIIDEFQNMIKENKNIVSLFQSIIDTQLKNSNTKLVLLGSSTSIIKSHVLSYKSPLYGRRTASLKLRPVGYFNLGKFFPKANAEDLINIYGFADGIPHYLIKINTEFWRWLENEIRKETSIIKDEADFMMKYEFSNPSTYKLVLEAIAHGRTKLNEIKNHIGAKRTDITPYLNNLINVDMIKREVPVTENIRSRKGRYYLKDNFLKFWFRYIYPNLSSIEQGTFSISEIARDYNRYLGKIFEDVCSQYLAKKHRQSKIGRWWHRDKEIDIVMMKEETKEIFFAECKWQERVNAEKILRELKEKSEHVDWNNGKRKEKYIIFAKSFKNRIREAECIDLKEIERTLGN